MKLEWNMLNSLDNTIKTKPGYRTSFKLPNGNLYVMEFVQDKDGLSCLIMIIDWSVYISKYPFKTYNKLEI